MRVKGEAGLQKHTKGIFKRSASLRAGLRRKEQVAFS
jgi:hypothetical protein